MPSAQRIFQSLLGSWRFERVISNYGAVSGTARFTAAANDPDMLTYAEQCVLIHGGLAYRNYAYRYEHDTIHVYFADGEGVENAERRLFHRLRFVNDTAAHANHLCINDAYDGVYTFLNENNFVVEYTVVGPQKDYTIKTQFERKRA